MCLLKYRGSSMTSMDKNVDRRVRRTKAQLKQAFIKLMEVKSYDQITVTDIVNQADYNRATFNRHYNFKEELAEELISDKTMELIETFNPTQTIWQNSL
jgi:AcrR family transcriptional regulator